MIDYNKEQKELEILWTIKQTAQYLFLKPGTIYRWISEGRVIDKSKIVRFSSKVRIPRSEVMRIAGVVKSNLKNNI